MYMGEYLVNGNMMNGLKLVHIKMYVHQWGLASRQEGRE